MATIVLTEISIDDLKNGKHTGQYFIYNPFSRQWSVENTNSKNAIFKNKHAVATLKYFVIKK